VIDYCEPEIRDQVLDYLELRFGLPRAIFDQFGFYAGPKGRVIVGPKRFDDRISPDTAGLLIARVHKSVKPTTNLLQIFGSQVRRNVITLSRSQTLKYLQGLDIRPTAEDIVDATNGYVLLKYDVYALGCGLYQADAVKNMLPRAKRIELEHL
jgi:NOL1/NOP2/fmu family ribosome biogenesis protein